MSPVPNFQLLQTAAAPPTFCALCRTHHLPFVDTGRMFPGHGRVYVCRECAQTCGRLFGMLDLAEAEKLRANVRTLETDLAAVRVELEREREEKVLSLEDARILFAEREPTVIPVEVAAGGEPVTGKATPERPRRKQKASA